MIDKLLWPCRMAVLHAVRWVDQRRDDEHIAMGRIIVMDRIKRLGIEDPETWLSKYLGQDPEYVKQEFLDIGREHAASRQ